MAEMICVSHRISKLSAIRLEVSLQVAEEAPWSIFHHESSHVLMAFLVGRINVIQKITYRFHFLLVSITGGNMVVHSIIIRA